VRVVAAATTDTRIISFDRNPVTYEVNKPIVRNCATVYNQLAAGAVRITRAPSWRVGAQSGGGLSFTADGCLVGTPNQAPLDLSIVVIATLDGLTTTALLNISVVAGTLRCRARRALLTRAPEAPRNLALSPSAMSLLLRRSVPAFACTATGTNLTFAIAPSLPSVRGGAGLAARGL
jgi:hypothetical protein